MRLHPLAALLLFAGGIAAADGTEPRRAPEPREETPWGLSRPASETVDRFAERAWRDWEADPRWPAQRYGERAAELEAWPAEARRERLRARVTEESGAVVDALAFYAYWADTLAGLPQQSLCALNARSVAMHRDLAARAGALENELSIEWPLGFQLLVEDGGAARQAMDRIAAEAKRLEPKFAFYSAQCEHGREQLALSASEREVGAVSDAVRAALSGGALARLFENEIERPGPGLDPAGTAGPGKSPPGGPGAQEKLPVGPKPPVSPEASYEALTEGVVFLGLDKGTARETQRAKETFAQALRHIYDIPEGRKVLADLQTMRRAQGERWKGTFTDEILQQEREKIEQVERAVSLLESGKGLPKPGKGRILAPTDDPLVPYRALAACPKGTAPVRTDVPQPGDRACRPADEPRGLYAWEAGKGLDAQPAPAERLERCPKGQTPVLTNKPAPGDRACRDAADVPAILVASGDPFKPYEHVDRCPARTAPVVTNWPRPGDLGCSGPGKFGDLKAARERLARLKDAVAGLEWAKRASAAGEPPEIGVAFEDTGPLAGGHAAPLHFMIWKHGDGRFAHVGKVEVSPAFLKDGNPARAVDKVLLHELRHMADQGLFLDEAKSPAAWQIGEDRAYLAEARAVTEQLPKMSAEPRSPFIEHLRDQVVTQIVRRPESFRLRYLTDPLYVWNVTPPDLKDPRAALRGRLLAIHGMLAGAPERRRADILRRVDRGGIAQALERAEGEAGDWRRIETLFVQYAAESQTAKDWVEGLETMSREPAASKAAWRKRFHESEREFWRDLEAFVSEQRRKDK